MRYLRKSMCDLFPVVHYSCPDARARLMDKVVADSASNVFIASKTIPSISPPPSVNSVDRVTLCSKYNCSCIDHKLCRYYVKDMVLDKSDAGVAKAFPRDKPVVEHSSYGSLGSNSVHNGSTYFSKYQCSSIEFEKSNKCSCRGYCKYNSINGTNFGDYGFIPLQPLGIITEKGINTGLKMGFVDLHKLLNHQGIHNCIERQFQIPTELNIPLWENCFTGTGITS